jgi:hypothetical protein
MPQTSTRTQADAAVLSRAVLRAAEILAVSHKALANILGVSAASLSRLAKGARQIPPDTKEGELAILFLRVFRSLDALVGGSDRKGRDWFNADNSHLGGKPSLLVENVTGLVHVLEYLDAMRGTL